MLALAMTQIQFRDSRGAISPGLCDVRSALETKGAGNAGRSMRPQPRVQIKKHTSVVTTVTSDSPDIPRAMVLTGYPVLSPAIRLFDTVVYADNSAQLDADLEASGPHDLAVRFRAVRQKRIRVHRIPPRVS